MTDPKTLCIAHLASGDLWGGAEAQLLTLAIEQSRNEFVEVHVLLMNEGELASRLRDAGIDVVCLDESSQNGLRLLRAIRSWLKSIQANVLHTHRQKENVLGSIANWLGQRAVSVRTQHGAAEFSLSTAQKVIDRIDRFCGLKLQKRVIAVSDDLRKKLLASFPAAHITTIHNGLDEQATQAKAKAQSPPDWYEPGIRHVGIVGRLTPVKRIDIFVDVARQLADIETRFHVFGDGTELQQWQAAGDDLNKEKAFEALQVHGHRDDIAACIAHLDVLVMCSDHEGLPMTLLESCALGTTIVAHKVGGIPELVSEDAGILVDEHTAEGYRAAVKQVLLSQQQRIPPGATRGPELPEKFSAKGNADATLALYRQLLPRTEITLSAADSRGGE